MADKHLNVFEMAQEQVKSACDKLGLEPNIYELIKEPRRVIEVNIPVKMDDGSIKVFKGFRSQHNEAVGPTKGGIRFHPAVSLEEVKALSIWMTFKCGVTGIPYGGGKGGIIVDPAELSEGELERLSRGYIQGIYKLIGEKVDIPAPDVNTNGKIMAWMVDEYEKLTGQSALGVLTGKPVNFHGSLGRNEATGYGVAVTCREAAARLGIDLKQAKVAVQGFGNVGAFTCKNIQKLGGTIVAMAEWDKEHGTYAIYKEDGLDFQAMWDYRAEKGTLYGFDGAKNISLEEFWASDVDIVVPAALENAIDEKVAKSIKAKLVCEAANGPTTPEGDAVLNERGITLTPDILTNAGGVTVSYFEWVQNLYGYYWSEEEVESKEDEAMVRAFNNVWAIKTQYDVPCREAAYMYSIKSVADAMKLRGWY